MARADTFAANPHWLPALPGSALDHVPGEDGWPIVGNTFRILADPPGHVRRMHATYGKVYRNHSFGGRNVTLLGPEANELVLFDRDKIFSSEQGWGPTLNQLFPRGLMLMDFEKHRVHRRTLSVAFKPEPMRLYADVLNDGISKRVKEWRQQGEIKFYPEIKQLTLELAAVAFLGTTVGPEADKVNKSFVDMVQASIAPVRTPIPGLAMGKGVAGRKYLLDYFGREVPRRRKGNGEDMFSQICRVTHEDGSLLSDDEIVDHMNFLMMAAHDTITSSGTSMVMQLGRNPDWQDRLRDEMDGLGINDDALPYDRLGDLVLTDYAFKESMRLMPPVPSIPRRAIKPFSFGGYDFPAGTFVGINTHFTHTMPEIWPEPQAFDPLRFSPDASKGRHKFAYVPFGGGAHMCLGLHFATMQIKILMWHILRGGRIDLPQVSGDKWQAWPIPKPRDGLPVRLTVL
ncbi:MAG TPA: cytochrome P450 [Sphingomonas sp.]|jgi:cytochrome P450|nr:cytochrome P450 [Sphingomonas sp.]